MKFSPSIYKLMLTMEHPQMLCFRGLCDCLDLGSTNEVMLTRPYVMNYAFGVRNSPALTAIACSLIVAGQKS